MEISKETVERVATLARLRFSEEEKERIRLDMEKIVSYFEKMNGLDTEGVEPLVFMVDEVNAFREDVATLEITKPEALKNAPQKNSDYFKVPKFIERE